jgi:hypothetical protein
MPPPKNMARIWASIWDAASTSPVSAVPGMIHCINLSSLFCCNMILPYGHVIVNRGFETLFQSIFLPAIKKFVLPLYETGKVLYNKAKWEGGADFELHKMWAGSTPGSGVLQGMSDRHGHLSH